MKKQIYLFKKKSQRFLVRQAVGVRSAEVANGQHHSMPLGVLGAGRVGTVGHVATEN
jgi:hypothetical protein